VRLILFLRDPDLRAWAWCGQSCVRATRCGCAENM